MGDLPCILSLFYNKFDTYNKTQVQMFVSIYHMTLKLLSNHIFGMKMLKFCYYVVGPNHWPCGMHDTFILKVTGSRVLLNLLNKLSKRSNGRLSLYFIAFLLQVK